MAVAVYSRYFEILLNLFNVLKFDGVAMIIYLTLILSGSTSYLSLELQLSFISLWQARQAYLLGNKALAKELSLKGQLYNMQMKAAHEKAKETIYQKRLVCVRVG